MGIDSTGGAGIGGGAPFSDSELVPYDAPLEGELVSPLEQPNPYRVTDYISNLFMRDTNEEWEGIPEISETADDHEMEFLNLLAQELGETIENPWDYIGGSRNLANHPQAASVMENWQNHIYAPGVGPAGAKSFIDDIVRKYNVPRPNVYQTADNMLLYHPIDSSPTYTQSGSYIPLPSPTIYIDRFEKSRGDVAFTLANELAHHIAVHKYNNPFIKRQGPEHLGMLAHMYQNEGWDRNAFEKAELLGWQATNPSLPRNV